VIILTIRTDKPEAEIGLYDDHNQLAYEVWHAHRELSVTLHQKIVALLDQAKLGLADLSGLVAFAGPGSFTGLRIGLTVANALAYGLQKPIVAAQNKDWIAQGIARLQNGESDTIALPEYGAPVHITTQKK
jgi:tRNA threonylcarbamoyladenosine biosynthesis protein TsaB